MSSSEDDSSDEEPPPPKVAVTPPAAKKPAPAEESSEEESSEEESSEEESSEDEPPKVTPPPKAAPRSQPPPKPVAPVDEDEESSSEEESSDEDLPSAPVVSAPVRPPTPKPPAKGPAEEESSEEESSEEEDDEPPPVKTIKTEPAKTSPASAAKPTPVKAADSAKVPAAPSKQDKKAPAAAPATPPSNGAPKKVVKKPAGEDTPGTPKSDAETPKKKVVVKKVIKKKDGTVVSQTTTPTGTDGAATPKLTRRVTFQDDKPESDTKPDTPATPATPSEGTPKKKVVKKVIKKKDGTTVVKVVNAGESSGDENTPTPTKKKATPTKKDESPTPTKKVVKKKPAAAEDEKDHKSTKEVTDDDAKDGEATPVKTKKDKGDQNGTSAGDVELMGLASGDPEKGLLSEDMPNSPDSTKNLLPGEEVDSESKDIEEGPRGKLAQWGDQVSTTIRNIFIRLGLFIGLRPKTTIVLSLIFVAFCMLGYSQFRSESRQEKLWVPSDSPAQGDKAFVEKYFGRPPSMTSVLISRKDGADMLEPETLTTLLKIHNQIVSTVHEYTDEDEEGNDVKKRLTWKNMCLRVAGTCAAYNIMEVFDYKKSNWNTREKIMEKVNAAAVYSRTGEKVDIKEYLGDLEVDGGGQVVTAQTVHLKYMLRNQEEFDDTLGLWYSEEQYKWEIEVLDTIEDLMKAEDFADFDIYRSNGSGVLNESLVSAVPDSGLMTIALFMIVAYAMTMLSIWKNGALGFRMMLTFGGVLSVILAISSSYGLTSWLGVFATPLSGILPFLLVGLGVDDMFVIVHEFDKVDPSWTIEKRLAMALAHAGPAITLTSFTDFFAFLIGSNTTLPALRMFCIQAAVGILVDYLLQVTFFCAILAMDQRVKRSGFVDCCWCCMGKQDYKQWEGRCCWCHEATDDKLEKFMRDRLGAGLADWRAKAAVCTIFGLMAAVGVSGCVQIHADADVNNFLPPGSYIESHINKLLDDFKTIGFETSVVFREDMDYTKRETWAAMEAVYQAFKESEFVVAETVVSWMHDFLEARPAVTPASFTADLDQWLLTDGKYHTENIIFSRESEAIVTSRIIARHYTITDSITQVKSMDTTRRDVRQALDDFYSGKQPAPAPAEAEEEGGGEGEDEASRRRLLDGHGRVESFVFAKEYLTYEQYKTIEGEALMNLSISLLTVMIVITGMLVNPIASFLVCMNVGLIVMEVVGFMYYWGLMIDSVTVILLVISLGLSVDYSAHIGHAYMHCAGTADERMQKALGDTGVAVVNGGMSTLIAVLVLSLSQTYVFQTFFIQLFLCTTFGMAHGMVFLPVALSILNPAPYKQQDYDYTDTKFLDTIYKEEEALDPKKKREQERAKRQARTAAKKKKAAGKDTDAEVYEDEDSHRIKS